jgi:hypothetical protein
MKATLEFLINLMTWRNIIDSLKASLKQMPFIRKNKRKKTRRK